MPFDQFAGELIDHARLDAIEGVAGPQPRLSAPLDLVHCGAVLKHLGQPAQAFAETYPLIETVTQARVARRSRERPELGRTQ